MGLLSRQRAICELAQYVLPVCRPTPSLSPLSCAIHSFPKGKGKRPKETMAQHPHRPKGTHKTQTKSVQTKRGVKNKREDRRVIHSSICVCGFYSCHSFASLCFYVVFAFRLPVAAQSSPSPVGLPRPQRTRGRDTSSCSRRNTTHINNKQGAHTRVSRWGICAVRCGASVCVSMCVIGVWSLMELLLVCCAPRRHSPTNNADTRSSTHRSKTYLIHTSIALDSL